MLTTSYINPRYFEKIVRVKDGRLLRVRFVIAEIDGELCWKVLSAAPITALQSRFKIHDSRFKEKEIFLLKAGTVKSDVKDQGLRINDCYTSPYFNNLKYFVSHPIRGPDCVLFSLS